MLATSTIAEGVNLDADLVLQGMWELSGNNGGILGPKRWGAYRNAAGRAGRPGSATQGWAILWTRSTAERDRALHFLRTGATPLPAEPFRWRDAAITSAIRHLQISDPGGLRSFLDFVEPGNNSAELVLERLYALRWIEQRNDKLFVMTDAGRLAATGIVPPLSAHHCAAAIRLDNKEYLTSILLSAWTERFGFQLRHFRALQSRENRLELLRQIREGESLAALADRFQLPEGLLEDWQSFASHFDKITGMVVPCRPPEVTPAAIPGAPTSKPLLIVHLDSNGDVTYNDRRVSLTRYQFALLELLARRLESGATYRAIFDHVWQGLAKVEQQQIGYLRRAIEKRVLGSSAKLGGLIETRPGFGLVLRLSKEQVRIERPASATTLRDSRDVAIGVPPVRTRRTQGLKSEGGSASILSCGPAIGSTSQNRPPWHRTAPRW